MRPDPPLSERKRPMGNLQKWTSHGRQDLSWDGPITGRFRSIVPGVLIDNSKSNANAWAWSKYVPFFETVICYLGGLLAAHALSGKKVLLDRAAELAMLLEPAFNTSSGLPKFGVNPETSAITAGISGILAEIALCQLEWTYTAHATGNKTHYDRVNTLINTLADAMELRKGGMFPTQWHLNTGKPTSESHSVGAAADSAHEYLLKQYLLMGKTDIDNLEMYLLTTNEVLTHLMYITPNRELVYVTETFGASFSPSHHFEHLACFFPGLLALGAYSVDLNLYGIDRGKLNPEARQQYDLLSKYDLRALHMAAPSGLGPEVVDMEHTTAEGKNGKGKLWMDAVEEWHRKGRRGLLPGTGGKKAVMYTRPEGAKVGGGPWDYVVRRADYFLRPETLESIYLMWRTTGNAVWRERGWEIFEAIEREAKTASGYASLKNVKQSPAPQSDEQPRSGPAQQPVRTSRGDARTFRKGGSTVPYRLQPVVDESSVVRRARMHRSV
ncbi:glycoside hydrolase [Trametes elegans]|nr:glycoside hydrolase [Trametes elegans]